MAITYSKGSGDASIGSAPTGGTSHLTATAIAVSIVFIVVAGGLWFGFSQSKKVIEAVPAAIIPLPVTPEIQQARVYEAIDGMEQCHKNTPDLGDAASRKKRQNCYYAVMTIFATSSVCDIITLDAGSSELCKQAQLRFAVDFPNGMQTESLPVAPTNTNAGATGGAAASNTNTSGTAGSTQKNSNSNTNTNSQPTSNANINSNTTGNVNTSTTTNGNTNTSANQNSNNNTNESVPPSGESALCLNEKGEPILLQHTNSCQ